MLFISERITGTYACRIRVCGGVYKKLLRRSTPGGLMTIKKVFAERFVHILGPAGPGFVLLSGALGMAHSARAQEAPSATLETIVVTATRRAESILDVPVSITAISEKEIQESGAQQAEDLVRMVPGLAYTENSAGQAVLAVRGIQTSAVFGNLQQAVALYADDVPVLDLTIPWTVPKLQLFDVNRVEVLRGPQGTLFGAGALSGAVHVVSNKPDMTSFQAATEDTLTTTDGGSIGGTANLMVNAPIVQDQLAVRAVGYYDYSPGWIDNPTLGESNGNYAETYGGRLEVKWVPVQNLDIVATIAPTVNHPHDSAYVPYGSNSDVANFRIRTYNTDNDEVYNLAVNYSMPWATLTSSTSYLDRHATSSMDFSGYANLLTGLTTVSPLLDNFNTNNLLQEFRLASSQEHPFKWLVGLFGEDYHFKLHETIQQEGVAGLGYPTDQLENVLIKTNIKDWAVFGEASYDLTTRLTFTAGARYTHYSLYTSSQGALDGETIFDGPPSYAENSASNSATTPKFSLAYKLNDDAMVYVLADKGFRTGNANLATKDPFTGEPLPSSYAPDSLWNYELGTKWALFDHRLDITAAAYYIDWQKIQLQVRTASGIPYTANAGSATSKGLELEIVGKPINTVEMGTSLAFNRAKLTEVNPGVPDAEVGDQLPGSAHFTAYVYGQYTARVAQSSNLIFRADYSYTGEQFSDLGNAGNPDALTYGSYSDVGARATLQTGGYNFGLFVDNLGNNRGRIAARTYFLEDMEIRQQPRTFGVTFRKEW
jgi:iron complex outermembrane recepter protein